MGKLKRSPDPIIGGMGLLAAPKDSTSALGPPGLVTSPPFFLAFPVSFFLNKICLAAIVQMIDLFSVTSCMLRVVLQVVRHSNIDHTNSVELGDDSCMHVIRSAS